MKLFKISDKDKLIEINKFDFKENSVYLVDDEEKNTVYFWVGSKVPEKEKEIIADIARRFEKERGSSTKILIMKQDREYGSFLAMMGDLRKGLKPGDSIVRRPELILEEPSTTIKSVSVKEPPVEKTFKEPEKTVEDPEELEEFGLEFQIKEAAYYISLDNYSYNELCWFLAEKILKITLGMPSLEDIRKKAEEVFNSSCTYDELCWLNAEMDLLIKHQFLEKETKWFNQ
ncbi:MAG: hypothetical protein ACTSRI_18445 [Promethearchaeota archaeon]